MEPKVYKVKPSKNKWAIFRPDGSKVNEFDFTTEYAAQKYLDLLVSHWYCKSKASDEQ
jgi:hypothetical protein